MQKNQKSVRKTLPRPGKGELILCIDDEPLVTEILEQFLKLHGFKPIVTNSPSRGLEIVEDRNDIMLLIVDQNMPGMLGSDFLKKARAINPAPRRVILTGYGAVKKLKEAVENGDVHIVVDKPWEIQSFLATIEHLLSHNPEDVN